MLISVLISFASLILLINIVRFVYSDKYCGKMGFSRKKSVDWVIYISEG